MFAISHLWTILNHQPILETAITLCWYSVKWKDERCICLIIFSRYLVLFHRCSCGHCAPDRLQNPEECLCCKEIEKCVESLGSTSVLNEVEISPECITLHPGFRVVCLNRWSLRSAASKYKRIDGRKYRQIDREERWVNFRWAIFL